MNKASLKPGWRTVKLGDVVNYVRDRVCREETGLEYYLGGEHFDRASIHVNGRGTIANSPIGPAFHMRFKPGQTLLVSRNPHLRKASIAEFEGICADTTYVCEAVAPILLPELLPFLMQTDAFWEHAERNKRGSTNPYLNWSDFASFEFALPPIEEQKRIAELLWAADDVVEKYSAVDKALSSEQHALLTQYMPPDAPFEALRQGHIPGICSGRLRDMCEKITDGTHQPPVFTKMGVPFLLIENIAQGGVDWSVSKWISEETYARLTKTLRPRRGDVLYTVVGRFGDAILVDWDQPFAFQRHIAVIRPKTGVLDSRFLCYFLESSLGKKQASIYAEGLAQKTITLGSLGKFCIPTPPVEAQIRICHDLDAIGARRTVSQDTLESCKRLLAEMRNGLIAGVAHV